MNNVKIEITQEQAAFIRNFNLINHGGVDYLYLPYVLKAEQNDRTLLSVLTSDQVPKSVQDAINGNFPANTLSAECYFGSPELEENQEHNPHSYHLEECRRYEELIQQHPKVLAEKILNLEYELTQGGKIPHNPPHFINRPIILNDLDGVPVMGSGVKVVGWEPIIEKDELP